MKKILLSGLSIVGLLPLGHSQIVGADAFMKGNYVEVGINGYGGFEGADWDTAAPPVPGMHHRSGGAELFGFVANPQMDGWVNYDGDFYTPGAPENGWGFEIITDSGTVNVKAGNNRYPLWEIPGAIVSYTYTGGLHTTVWQGSYAGSGQDLDFTIEYNLYDTAMAYITTVTVSNNGPAIDEFYFYRTMDPDNNQSVSFDFITLNTVVSQPGPGSPIAHVKAESSVPWYSVVSFSANDYSARVSHGGFSNRDGSDIWNALPGLTPSFSTITSTGTYFGDNAISIAFKLDSLMSFRSARTFSYMTSFKGDMTMSNHDINLNEREEITIFPNPTSGLLNIHTKETAMNLKVYDAMGKLQIQSAHTNTIDLSSLDAGIYLVSIETGKGKVVKRIVKE